MSNVYETADEQLVLCEVRCKFIQYIANKPDKFPLKLGMDVVDADSKILY